MTVLQLRDGYSARTTTPPQVTITPAVTPATHTVAPAVDPAGSTVAGIAVYVPAAVQAAGATIFPFDTPTATWTVAHGLGRHPLVQLVTADGEQIDADVEFPDVNTVVATHAQPLAGAVVIF